MDDSHWAQHVATIRRLYVTERKTLREVKKIMEDQYGFPNIKLSIWETTLRDRLGVMKRLKKEQWRLLYYEYERRGQRPFDLYANDDLVYPWSKVWKEFRRRRDLPLPQNLTLPATLTMRALATELEQPAPLIHSGPESAVTTTVVTRKDISGLQHGWLDAAAADTREAFRGFIRVQTESIPWNVNRLESLARIMGATEVYGQREVDGNTVYALMPKDGFLGHVPGRFVGGRWLGRIADTRFPGPFLPDSTHHPFTEISAEFNAYHILNRLVYLASNNFIYQKDQWNDLLEMLAKRVPRKIVSAIFASSSFSIRAIWENAMRLARDVNGEALAFLIETILDQHFDWVEPIMNKHVLFAAAKSGNAALIRKLLAKGAHPGWIRPSYNVIPYRTAIIAAISVEAWDSVQLLLQKCEVEADLSLPTSSSTGTLGVDSQFSLLFQFIEADKATFWRTDPEDGLRFFSRTAWSQKLGSYMIALRLFLQAGANVDAPYIWTTEDFDTFGSSLHSFHEVNLTPLEWLPTRLERSLYWEEQLFNYLQTYSKVHDSTQVVTRSGILKALLDGGNDGLDQYFRIRSRPAPHVLEMLLVEQFFIDVPHSSYQIDRVNARTVRLLIGYGVAINSNVAQNAGGISLLLRRVITSAGNFGLDEDLRFILAHLILNGAAICKHTLQLAVGRSDIHVLEVLARHGADISQDGKFALLRAVNMRNYQALMWLLDNGVSVASEFPAKDSPSFYTLIGATVTPWHVKGVDVESFDQLEADYADHNIVYRLDIEMIRFLHGKGAQLRQQTSDLSSYQLLEQAIARDLVAEDFFAFIGDFPQEMARLSDSERKNLFATLGYKITCDQRLLECLRSRYEDFDTGVLLADAIRRGASGEAIERLLGDTSDVNFLSSGFQSTTPLYAAASVCNLRLVQVLLDRGADIDGRVGDRGFSPLGTACSYEPSTSEQAEERNRLIRFLVDQGADCYARGAGGDTPSNSLAERGDLENLRSSSSTELIRTTCATGIPRMEKTGFFWGSHR